MTITHAASTDGGTTPGTIAYTYDDGTNSYTNVEQNLRNTGVFKSGYEMGFVIRGVGRDSFGADFDTDVDVDGADFLTWQRGFGISSPDPVDGDANNDNNINDVDLAYWQSLYGKTDTTDSYAVTINNLAISIMDPTPLFAASTGVPEPSTLVLGLGSLMLLSGLRKSRRSKLA